MRRLSFLLILPALLALGDGPAVALAAPSTPCAPPATEFALAGTFPAPPLPIFDRAPILQVTLTGQSGAFEGHVVLQPVPAGQALSDGCQENSRFTVTAFTGTLTLTGTLAAQLFGFSPVVVSADQPTDASIQVHFGTEPSRPLFTFRSKTPVTLHTPAGPVPVRLLQIVGGQVVQAK